MWSTGVRQVLSGVRFSGVIKGFSGAMGELSSIALFDLKNNARSGSVSDGRIQIWIIMDKTD